MNAEEAGGFNGEVLPTLPAFVAKARAAASAQLAPIFRTAHSPSSFHRTLPDSCRGSSPLLRLSLTHQNARNGSVRRAYTF